MTYSRPGVRPVAVVVVGVDFVYEVVGAVLVEVRGVHIVAVAGARVVLEPVPVPHRRQAPRLAVLAVGHEDLILVAVEVGRDGVFAVEAVGVSVVGVGELVAVGRRPIIAPELVLDAAAPVIG